MVLAVTVKFENLKIIVHMLTHYGYEYLHSLASKVFQMQRATVKDKLAPKETQVYMRMSFIKVCM